MILYPELFFQELVQDSNYSSISINDPSSITWNTVEQILFFYDSIQVIEYQDYLGIGCRLAQAKMAGLISSKIVLEVVCHSTIMHINTIEEIWPGLTQQPLLIKEKLAIELADKVRFTTEFMMERYRSFGYEIDPDRCYLQKHPFSFNKSEPFTLDQIDTLLFSVRETKQKAIIHLSMP